MAILALTDGYILINAVNYSDHCTKIELDVSADVLESTPFSSTYRTRIGGLKDGSLALTFNQDFAVANLDATLFALLGTVQTFEVRPTSSARSTSNPAYTGSILIAEWKPVANGVGELATMDLTFPTTGTITRQTA